ncbi:MAG: CBS domain-containing protein [Nitrospirota bacterium]|nr:MAG: CBS domain-containing protein [Nitrospirota bacterium]
MDPDIIYTGGKRLVGDISCTNNLRFHTRQNGLGIAVLLLSTNTPGAPVVDGKGKFLGFISEFDVLRALEAGKNLHQLTAEDLMVKDRVAVTATTTLAEAVKTMEKNRFLNLPIEKDGVVVGCLTRHDLLQAWIGIGLGIDPEVDDEGD